MRKPIIGVMGPGRGATDQDKKNAEQLGAMIAKERWILLSGGRNEGVMDAVSRGAKEAGGLVVGILPSKDGADASAHLDIALITGMGGARNLINILSSDVVVACGMGAGTASEVAHAIKAGKPVVLLGSNQKAQEFFSGLDASASIADTPQEAVASIQHFLAGKTG